MIKIYKNFFDSDGLEAIDQLIEKSKQTPSLRTSYPSYNSWKPNIIHDSTPVMIYDVVDDQSILLKQLKEVIDIKHQVFFMIYYWPVGSYIPWHDDAHASFTATVYCNRYWDKNWGGLLLYEEAGKILAEVPERNKLIVQTDHTNHCTTPVTKPYLCPISINGGYDMIPDIRTTMQLFEVSEEAQEEWNKKLSERWQWSK